MVKFNVKQCLVLERFWDGVEAEDAWDTEHKTIYTGTEPDREKIIEQDIEVDADED